MLRRLILSLTLVQTRSDLFWSVWRLDCDCYLGLYITSLNQLRTWAVDKNTLASLYHVLEPMMYAIVTSDNAFSVSLWNFTFMEKFRNFMVLFDVSYGTEQLCQIV